jgi:SAM-dependent methyltransferase
MARFRPQALRAVSEFREVKGPMSVIPSLASGSQWTLPFALDVSTNVFRDKFGQLDTDGWRDLLIASVTSPIINEVEFPHFPPPELQEQIHGSSGESALWDAAEIYRFVSSKPLFRQTAVPNANFLDFGAGWGRISRLFLRDFDLSRQFAFEPQRTTCFLARSLNPYACFMTGGEIPDQTLPPNHFELVVGWSVFSHLSEYSTIVWLEEMGRIMRRDGYCVFSTYGERFLDLLLKEEAEQQRGKQIHWYHRQCLEAAGDINEPRRRYLNGEFVWFGDGPTDHYGYAAFLHQNLLEHILRQHGFPLELVEFDCESLGQDVFILRRT